MDFEWGFWAFAFVALDIVVFYWLGKRVLAWYRKANADGEITMDELMDAVDEVKEIVAVVKEMDLPSPAKLKRMKKDELIELASEKGLDTSGTKADIVGRIVGMFEEE